MTTLSPEDIKLIGEEVGKVIERKITPRIKEILSDLRAVGRGSECSDGRSEPARQALQLH